MYSSVEGVGPLVLMYRMLRQYTDALEVTKYYWGNSIGQFRLCEKDLEYDAILCNVKPLLSGNLCVQYIKTDYERWGETSYTELYR